MEQAYADTPAERLAAEYFRGRDPAVRDRLVEAHLYIARIVARKFSGRGVDFDDLYQVASLALVKAIQRFDPGYGVKFASFVTPTMIGEVKNYFRDKSRLLRLPRGGAERLARLEKAREALEQRLLRAPTAPELAEEMHATLEEVLEALEMRGSSATQSLDSAPETEDEASPLSAFLGAEDAGFSRFENRDAVRRALAKLPQRERQVIELRFFGGLSQHETAERMGVSQMTVSRLERKALAALRGIISGA